MGGIGAKVALALSSLIWVPLAVTTTGWASPASAHPPLKDSLTAVENHLRSAPDDPRSLVARGEFRRVLGDHAGAEADFVAALALEPKPASTRLYRASLFLELGRPEDAIVDATSFLSSGSTDATLRSAAFIIRARAHRETGDLTSALADLDQALALAHRPPPELFLERFDLLQGWLPDRDPALPRSVRLYRLLEVLDEAMSLLGPTPALQLKAIGLEIQLGHVDQALGRLDTLRAQAERQDAWLEWRGEILLAAGRRREAAGAFAAALRSLDGHSTTRQAATATATRRLRLVKRVGELDVEELVRALETPTHLTLPAMTFGTKASAKATHVEWVVLTRGPYLELATRDSVGVRWRTDAASSSRVAWGPNPTSLGSEIVDLAEVTEHEVTVTGLDPSTCYVYEVGTATDVLAGGDTEHMLCTAPEEDASIRVWVIGDSGTADANARTVRDAYLEFFADPRPDVWLMLGDNAYPNGTDLEYQAAVFETYPTTLAHAVVWPTIGNHDSISSSSATQSGPYFENFTLPVAGEAGGMISGTEAYYSFDHPPYTNGSHDSDVPSDSGGRMFATRETVLPILESQGVDLILSGHSHSYERSMLLDGHYGTSDTLTPDMIVDGGDGSPIGDGSYTKNRGSRQGAVYAVAGSSGKLGGGGLNHPAMRVSLNELGSMVLFINSQELEAIFLDSASQPRDLFRIDKLPLDVFADGFDTGNTSAWAAQQPPQ